MSDTLNPVQQLLHRAQTTPDAPYLHQPGKGGWRDLVLTGSSRRSDRKPGRKPLHVHVRYDGGAYPLDAFRQAWAAWRR